jgi:hypothetical protein
VEWGEFAFLALADDVTLPWHSDCPYRWWTAIELSFKVRYACTRKPSTALCVQSGKTIKSLTFVNRFLSCSLLDTLWIS